MTTATHAMTAQPSGDVTAVYAEIPRVILASDDPKVTRRLGKALKDHCRLTTVTSIAEALQHVTSGPRPIVITTEQLRDGDAATLKQHLEVNDLNLADGIQTVCMLVSKKSQNKRDSEPLSSFFYVMAPTLEPSSLVALVHRAATVPHASVQLDTAERSRTHAFMTVDIITYTRRLAAESSLRGVAKAAVDALEGLFNAERAYCLYHDYESSALWSEATRYIGANEDDDTSVRGLSGYVAKTLRTVAVPHLSKDSRFDLTMDDPVAVGNERGLFHPMVGANGLAHAVFVVIRSAKSPPFDDKSRRTILEVTKQWTPIFQAHALQLEVERELEESEGPEEQPYRREALEEYDAPQEEGEIVRVIPCWIGYVYWGMIGVIISAIVAATIFNIGRYANGVAIVTREGAVKVAARQAGVVDTVHVQPGQRVEEGQLLLSFESQQEKQNLRQLDAEYNAAAVNWLENPSVEQTSAELASTHAKRRAAAEQLAERQLRAPRAGILGGLRVERGRPVAAGDVLLSIADEDSDPIVIAFLPGSERPHLTPDMVTRVKLDGENYPHQDTVLEYISDHVLPPADLARLVGSGLIESLKIEEPMVLARARLPSREITVRGKTLAIHSGMQAEFEVRIEQNTILSTLLYLTDLF